MTAGDVANPRPNPAQKTELATRQGFSDSLKRLFRAVAKAIIPPAGPTPEQRRKRREETERSFKKALPIMRRVGVPAPISHAVHFLADTLDWLHLWNWNHAPGNEGFETLDCYHSTEQHYESLDL